jgi:hypothetical protein
MTEKRSNPFPALRVTILGIVCLLLSAGTWVHAETDENGYAILIEQSPIHAGTVNPGLGVHKMGIGSTMTLIAMPKPGYRFLYWLGDVSNPASMATQVQIDAPKIVVAVYERDEFELPLAEAAEGLPSGAPYGGAHATPAVAGGGSGSMMAFYPELDYDYASFKFPDLPDEDDPFPVPGDDEDDDFPVPGDNPIPEPTTWCLLAAGSVLLRLQRGRE